MKVFRKAALGCERYPGCIAERGLQSIFGIDSKAALPSSQAEAGREGATQEHQKVLSVGGGGGRELGTAPAGCGSTEP